MLLAALGRGLALTAIVSASIAVAAHRSTHASTQVDASTAAGSSAEAGFSLQGDWDGIGKAENPATACSLDTGTPQNTWCSGFLGMRVKGNEKTLAKTISALSDDALKWNQPSEWVERKRAWFTTGDDPYFRVATLKDARNVPLEMLGQKNEGLIVARIEAQVNSARDTRYDIKDRKGWSRYYFVIVSKYENKNDDRNEGREVSRFEIYGLEGSGDNAKLNKEEAGALRYCKKKHSQSPDGANFLTCKDGHLAPLVALVQIELAKTLGPKKKVSLADVTLAIKAIETRFPALVATMRGTMLGGETLENRIFETREEQPEDPAWMACGGGCCVADDK